MLSSDSPAAIAQPDAGEAGDSKSAGQWLMPNAGIGILGLVLILLWVVFVLLYSPSRQNE